MARGRVAGRGPSALRLPFSVDGWLANNPLPPSGEAMFRAACGGAPLKIPRSGPHSVGGHWASAKMNELVGFDSHTVELRALILYDHLPSVLGYFVQACSLAVRYPGRRRPDMHLVDALVVEPGAAFLDEWKTEEELKLAAQGGSKRYVLERGRWRDEAAEKAASALGMTYRLRTDAELPATFIDNLEYLAPYGDPAAYEVPSALRERILNEVRVRPGITIRQLVELLS